MRRPQRFLLISLCAVSLALHASAQGSDDCASAPLILTTGTLAVSTVGSTDGAQQPGGCATIHHDVWFLWNATQSGPINFSTCGGTAADTVIAVYAGATCPTPGTEIACNDDSCGEQSRLIFNAVSGNSYLLQIGSFDPNTTFSGSVPPRPRQRGLQHQQRARRGRGPDHRHRELQPDQRARCVHARHHGLQCRQHAHRLGRPDEPPPGDRRDVLQAQRRERRRALRADRHELAQARLRLRYHQRLLHLPAARRQPAHGHRLLRHLQRRPGRRAGDAHAALADQRAHRGLPLSGCEPDLERDDGATLRGADLRARSQLRRRCSTSPSAPTPRPTTRWPGTATTTRATSGSTSRARPRTSASPSPVRR